MKVLVIGSGGREHAIVDALTRSPQVEKIYCAPGNAGIARQAECVDIRDTEVGRLRDFARGEGIGLTVVGPEAALAAGIVDSFREAGLRIFGPTKAAARIESSKEFAKDLMARYDIPTAGYRAFTDYEAARAYVAARPFPAVLKYDGLAAGKGVVIAQTMEEADEALRQMLLDDKFGEGKVVVEDFLEGPEFSLLCFVSGRRVWPMVLSQDHKRAYDGDKGPNTGGMGAYTPLPFITADDEHYAVERIVLPRLKSDIVDIFCAVADGRDAQLEWDDRPALGIVLASKGYPGSYEKGHEIKGLDKVEGTVYHMGTKADGDRILTAGGRVLFVVGRGATLSEARAAALRDVARIECDNLFHRSDIGHWALDDKNV